jgi:hypothetical protein
MRGFLLSVIILSTVLPVFSQQYSAKDFLFASSFIPKKFEGCLSKNKFIPSGSTMKNDTIVNTYSLRPVKKKKGKVPDPVKRNVETYKTSKSFSFSFLTSSRKEFDESKKFLTAEGFFCGNDNDTMDRMLYQKRNILVRVNKKEKEDTLYSFFFAEAELPDPNKIEYAEDLLQFYSHEYLLTIFGEKNVIKDVYYFSEKEIAKCSVLFPKTSRQVVFIWEDQVNLLKPSFLIVGGNTNNGSSVNYDGVVGENVWSSKTGVYSGMSINSLVKLNGNSFKFYGKNSESPYMILPENTGSLDFKMNRVVLGCLNPTGSRVLNNATVSAEDILSDNLGLYVYMMMILPSSVKK